MVYRAVVPGDEVPRTGAGGQPDAHRGRADETRGGGDKSRLHRHAAGSGARRDARLGGHVGVTEPEIATVEALNPTLEGKTDRQKNPHPPRSLAWAGWVIARLGNWHCYGKPPGPITFHRGMERFNAIHQGYILGSIT
jgi:hypothetical protein